MTLFEVDSEYAFINHNCITDITEWVDSNGNTKGSKIHVQGSTRHTFYDSRTPRELYLILRSL